MSTTTVMREHVCGGDHAVAAAVAGRLQRVLEAHGGLARRSPAGGLPARDEIGGHVPSSPARLWRPASPSHSTAAGVSVRTQAAANTASLRPQAPHERRRSPTTATCAETISAWSAAVSVLASVRSLSPRPARPPPRYARGARPLSPWSRRAPTPPPTSHAITSFGTSPPCFREPEAYLDRKPAPTGLHASHQRAATCQLLGPARR